MLTGVTVAGYVIAFVDPDFIGSPIVGAARCAVPDAGF
jgi:hypothetical protein